MVKVARNATHTCIIFEHNAENPREFYDPFGHMVCWKSCATATSPALLPRKA